MRTSRNPRSGLVVLGQTKPIIKAEELKKEEDKIVEVAQPVIKKSPKKKKKTSNQDNQLGGN